MQYKMKSGTSTVEERVDAELEAATDAQFVKFLPEEPEPEQVKEFLVAELRALLAKCLNVEGNGGYEKIALEAGVEVEFVKEMEAKALAEWERRHPAGGE